MCQGGFAVVGDQLSASSPFDPSFWVVHPSIERLWMWKKLQTSATLFRSFADEAWPTKGAAMVEGWGRFAAPGGFEARAAVPGHHLFVCGRARRARARAVFSRKQSRDRRRLSRSPGNILGI